MLSHHPAKIGGHRYCGREDIMFIGDEGQDFTCPRLDRSLLCISKAHDMPCSHTRNFRTET